MNLSKPQEYIVTSTQDVNLFLAGVGSGKTHLGGVISGYLIHNFPTAFGFIGANTHEQLTTSTLFRLREVWAELFGWKEDIDYVVNKKPPKSFNTKRHNFDSYRGIIAFKNGAIVFKGSLDNAKAHDGKEFSWAILDETKDSREEDVKETILTRLRKQAIYINTASWELTAEPTTKANDGLTEIDNKPFMPLYILTSPANVSWINDWFKIADNQSEILAKLNDKDDFYVNEFDDKCVVVSSTYHNEQNLPKGFINKILSNNNETTANKLIYGNPFIKSGGEFYSSFKRTKHVKSIPYKPHLPIHMSFDQNVTPYITATLYQLWSRGKDTIVNQFDEICLPNPKNTTSKLCLEFLRRYDNSCYGLFYYGDPSGRKRDTRANEHDYRIVDRMLHKHLNNQSCRVPYKHPAILKRRDFANNIFEGLYNIHFYINPKCKHSIEDFEMLKEDKNGKKEKKRVRDPDTGTTYEQYGHTSDSYDYFICEVFSPLYERNFR